MLFNGKRKLTPELVNKLRSCGVDNFGFKTPRTGEQSHMDVVGDSGFEPGARSKGNIT